MLAYILAIAVGLASLSLYLSAFFLPELHRKDDFLWSGVGLFYALVLWICAGRMTGSVLLGQGAAVSLVLCFGWQTLRLRRAIAHPDDKTDVTGFSLLTWVQNRFKKSSPPVTPPVTETQEEAIAPPETPQEETPVTSEVEPEQTSVTSELEPEQTPQEETPVTSEVEPEQTPVTLEPEVEETPVTSEVEPEQTPQQQPTIISELDDKEVSPEPTEENTEDISPSNITKSPESKKQGFSFKSIFGLGKSQTQPTPEPLETDIEESNWDDDDDLDDLSDVEEVSSPLVEETEAIASETVTEIPEITAEETTEQDKPKITESLEEYVTEFEPYMADNDAETLIEDYKPQTEESKLEITDQDDDQSEEIDKIDKETSKTEDKN